MTTIASETPTRPRAVGFEGLPDGALDHRLDVPVIGGEVGDGSGARDDLERHTIRPVQLVDEARRGEKRLPARASPDVGLIDDDHDQPAGRLAGVRAERRRCRLRVLEPPQGDELGRSDLPWLAVHLEGEVCRLEIVNRTAVPIDDAHVHRDDVDSRAERGLALRVLWRGRSLLGERGAAGEKRQQARPARAADALWQSIAECRIRAPGTHSLPRVSPRRSTRQSWSCCLSSFLRPVAWFSTPIRIHPLPSVRRAHL